MFADRRAGLSLSATCASLETTFPGENSEKWWPTGLFVISYRPHTAVRGEREDVVLLSLFCGAGGLDLGFERAGFEVALAFDKNPDSVASYNHNRAGDAKAFVADVTSLSLSELDLRYGSQFDPRGVIGGPPCQSFSRANRYSQDDDPRHVLPIAFARLLKELNDRKPVEFFLMENVVGLLDAKHEDRLFEIEASLEAAGFSASRHRLRASDFDTPQIRDRIFWVGFNKSLFPGKTWIPPSHTTTDKRDVTVRRAIGHLPEPTHFRLGLSPQDIAFHPNHWCMAPKSPKFTTEGALRPGVSRTRSFKSLSWDMPSPTVAYGNREVHVHPGCHRRLSVYEALLLQGFPKQFELLGTLSSQITQVSEAVPPPLAAAVANSIAKQLASAALAA